MFKFKGNFNPYIVERNKRKVGKYKFSCIRKRTFKKGVLSVQTASQLNKRVSNFSTTYY